MKTMVVGASKGLGKALIEGLGEAGDTLLGVSRSRPEHLDHKAGVEVKWIEANLAKPAQAAQVIAETILESGLDTLIYNLGIWEEFAFDPTYNFLADDDDQIEAIVTCNITSTLLLIKRLLPVLLKSPNPRIILTGSTSGLPQSGRPEVAFGASKFALRGIADALREGYRQQRLAVTCLNLGYLNTQDPLSTPRAQAEQRDEGHSIPVHDVVQVVRMALSLSSASFVKEITLPAILDERF
ncbi:MULTISPECIES: SDR family NAD(P)-dependent oxidoreductase [Pseudomonas]|uniref:SDR family NAD(P)-dependent oxidoreductase n=1 Tax=Pseudomonas TaxID=286 RepID=UPI000812B843|nr:MULTISPECIES: SDR family oxidoreductase [unclassified Pseudomonas]MBW8126909.1 SDR family oxidoreductase [Pseudomonas sp. LAP_36]MBW8135070.1 SDR family oxidoreductase [Pseudomonas sp. PAMC 26818]CRM02244.1 3-oxoacyl-[acyl-carrier-protein] reductase FabG [Pseudomonas sp. 24 R 17]CRM16787.1 3-oxoacyl-[acyl-carrier-protein] reductase FabG [Pseudomonas sp. 24 E 1]